MRSNARDVNPDNQASVRKVDGLTDALWLLREAGFDDQECGPLLLELVEGSQYQPVDGESRTYTIKAADNEVGRVALNARGKIKKIEIGSHFQGRLLEVVNSATLKLPRKVLSTTLFSHRQIAGYAKVDDWIQIRPANSSFVDVAWPDQVSSSHIRLGQDYALVMKVCHSPSALPLFDAHLRRVALRDARWLMNTFLELALFKVRGELAYVMLNGTPTLAEVTAPHLKEPTENAFSDTTGLLELSPTDHKTYFEQLGVGHSDFRVPDLAHLRSQFVSLAADDQKRFLRASAYLFDSADPAHSEGSRIIAAISAIEALLEASERCKECSSHIGIRSSFRKFVAEFVAPDHRVIRSYDALYPERSRISHGTAHPELDESRFGLGLNEAYWTRLVAWSAAKRGLIGWLDAKATQAHSAGAGV